MTLRFVEKSLLPTQWGVFHLHGFEEDDTGKEHVAISMGEPGEGDEAVLVRVHSECLTGDALGSLRCDCGSQLQEAMRQIAECGRGALLYLRQEGLGIGLLNKIRAYHLQDQGADTVEANEQLGFGADLRDYSGCLAMLQHLNINRVKLLTNNPRKVTALEALGVDVAERISLETGRNSHNAKYLATKAGKLGHLFDPSEN